MGVGFSDGMEAVIFHRASLPEGSSLPEVRSKARPSEPGRTRALATVRNASTFVQVAPNSSVSWQRTSRVRACSLRNYGETNVPL